MFPAPTSHSVSLGPGVAGPSLANPTAAPWESSSSNRNLPQVPSCGAEAFLVQPDGLAGSDPRKHTTYPYVTGTSVLGLVYKDGVLLAADMLGAKACRLVRCGLPAWIVRYAVRLCRSCLVANAISLRTSTGSYGSTKRYKSVSRLKRINDSTIVGASGELSDFAYINTLLEELATEDFTFDDGISLTPKEVGLPAR
jgi:20S proteasome subunit beta 7